MSEEKIKVEQIYVREKFEAKELMIQKLHVKGGDDKAEEDKGLC